MNHNAQDICTYGYNWVIWAIKIATKKSESLQQHK